MKFKKYSKFFELNYETTCNWCGKKFNCGGIFNDCKYCSRKCRTEAEGK